MQHITRIAPSPTGMFHLGSTRTALFNWLLRLGWGPNIDDRTTRTIIRDRALELFLNGGKMRSSPANLDRAMLDSLDRRYKATK